MASNEHVFDLLPAYALDCLDVDDLVRVSEHLTNCSDCRAELGQIQEVVDQLGLAVPFATPPASLKRRLTSQVERQQPAQPSGWHQVRNNIRYASPVWGLISLGLILILAVSTMFLWQRVNRLEAVTEPAPLRTIALTGTEYAPGATGLIVLSLDGEHGSLVVDQLPELETDQQYQLWLIRDDRRVSGGVFSVSEEGYGLLWVSTSEPLDSFSAVGISIEPAGGSDGPTGEKVLGGTLN